MSGVLSTEVRAAQHALHESFSHRIPLFVAAEHVLLDALFDLLLVFILCRAQCWTDPHACLPIVSMLSRWAAISALGLAGRDFFRSTPWIHRDLQKPFSAGSIAKVFERNNH